MINVEAYLFFEGRTEEALQYYQQKLGAKVDALIRQKVMHSLFRIGDTKVMASDGNCAGKPNFQGFALTLNAASPAEAEKRFNALAEGGKVNMPLGETFFAKSFGMVADRFGVNWMVMAGPKNP